MNRSTLQDTRPRFAGITTIALATALSGCTLLPDRAVAADGLHFLQLSNIRLGSNESAADRYAPTKLTRAVEVANEQRNEPDFVIVTGDLTLAAGDASEQRRRLDAIRAQLAGLKAQRIYVVPDSVSTAFDHGATFTQTLGPTHYSFDAKGVHFVVLDDVSDPNGALGDTQLGWLRADLGERDAADPIVVFAGRPLLEASAPAGAAGADSTAALQLLGRFRSVSTFYATPEPQVYVSTSRIGAYATAALGYSEPVADTSPRSMRIAWNGDEAKRKFELREVTRTPQRGFVTKALSLAQAPVYDAMP